MWGWAVSELAQDPVQVRILVLFFILFPQRIRAIIEACDSGFYCRTSGLHLWWLNVTFGVDKVPQHLAFLTVSVVVFPPCCHYFSILPYCRSMVSLLRCTIALVIKITILLSLFVKRLDVCWWFLSCDVPVQSLMIYDCILYLTEGRDSSVGTATTYGLDGRGIKLSIPVAERSEVRVCVRSPAGIAGSNPSGGMDVCVVCCKYRQKAKFGRVKTKNQSTRWENGSGCSLMVGNVRALFLPWHKCSTLAKMGDMRQCVWGLE